MTQEMKKKGCLSQARDSFDNEPYVSRRDVCHFLGISIPTLMKLRKQGLPVYSVGSQKRFKLSEVDQFISGNKGGSINYAGLY